MTDDEHDDPMIGAELEDRYRVTARLGEGGMGVVYRAEHLIFGTQLALKVLKSAAAQTAEALQRLEREAQAASAIGDPHVVDVKDFGRTPAGDPYVVMEHLEGLPLSQLVYDGSLPWRRAARIAHQVARGLAAAHEVGVIHRDLKAENVLLVLRQGDPDFVKIFDFGIAKLAHADIKLTKAGVVLGTPQYMSPEQCGAGGRVDHRTDIYALGVLLYEMLTGDVPFDSDDVWAICLAHIQTPVPAPRQLVPELPEALEVIVLRCLEKDAADRYDSMDEVAVALAALDGFVANEIQLPRLRVAAPASETPRSVPALVMPTIGADLSIAATLPSIQIAPLPKVRPAAPTISSAPAAPRFFLRRLLRGALVAGAVAGVAAAALVVSLGLGGRGVPSAAVASASRATSSAFAIGSDLPLASATDPVASPPETHPPIHQSAAPAAAQPWTMTRLRSFPSGASVLEDGVRLGTTPLSLDRPAPGARRELQVRHVGHRERRVVIGALSDDELFVRLRPEHVSSAPMAPRGVRRATRARSTGAAPHAADAPASDAPEDSAGDRGPTERSSIFLDPWAGS
ncbi:MAG: serine/threonine protein kinase [Sandaracinaceae bacterium]|nr:serine/threonine protein kinase [Sandaracinaceae bacterium]